MQNRTPKLAAIFLNIAPLFLKEYSEINLPSS